MRRLALAALILAATVGTLISRQCPPAAAVAMFAVAAAGITLVLLGGKN